MLILRRPQTQTGFAARVPRRTAENRHAQRLSSLRADRRMHAAVGHQCACADAAYRPCRGSRRARSDARAKLRRPHRVRRALRQVVRHRREAQYRPATRRQLRMVGRQQGVDDQAAPGRDVSRRRETRRCRREVQPRAPQDNGRFQQARRACAACDRRRRRRSDRAPQPDGAVLAAARATGRSRRDDRLAKGSAGRGRQIRREARMRRSFQVRRARRAGPHRARTLCQLLEQG